MSPLIPLFVLLASCAVHGGVAGVAPLVTVGQSLAAHAIDHSLAAQVVPAAPLVAAPPAPIVARAPIFAPAPPVVGPAPLVAPAAPFPGPYFAPAGPFVAGPAPYAAPGAPFAAPLFAPPAPFVGPAPLLGARYAAPFLPFR